MNTLSARRLHDLFDENPHQEALCWTGQCHDCQAGVEITATPRTDGIHIQGGAVYEPAEGRFYFKCEACHRAEPALQNFQPCEVYSRVVGYLRPVSQWNDGKQAEFALRKTFDASLSGAQ